MNHANADRLERHSLENSKSLPRLEDDPVLARVEMGLAASNTEIADIIKAGNHVGANTGGHIMEMLIGMMAHQPECRASCNGPANVQAQNPASSVNAVSTGIDGLGRGLNGIAASSKGLETGHQTPAVIPDPKSKPAVSAPQSNPSPTTGATQATSTTDTTERARVVKSFKLKELEPATVEVAPKTAIKIETVPGEIIVSQKPAAGPTQ